MLDVLINNAGFGMSGAVERWVALQDASFAVLLKGAPSRIVEAFGLSAKEASRLLLSGLRTGSIALLDAETGAQWLPSESALAQQVDWASGTLRLPGVPPRTLVIHWPDVESAIQAESVSLTIDAVQEAGAVSAIQETATPRLATDSQRTKPGPKGAATEKAAASMLADLRASRITEAALSRETKQEALAARYKVSRDTMRKARQRALSEFVGDTHAKASPPTSTIDK